MEFRNIISIIVLFSYLSAYIFIVVGELRYALMATLTAMLAVYAYVIHLDVKSEIEKETEKVKKELW